MLSKIHGSARPVAALAAIVFSSLFAAPDASALTAKQVTEKMSSDQRSSYLFGMIEMLQAEAVIAGDKPRAECIFNAYFNTSENDSGAMTKIIAALSQFPDKQTTDIVYLITKKTCGG